MTVDLATGSAVGFTSVAGIENVIGGSAFDTLTGNTGNNRLDGGARSTTPSRAAPATTPTSSTTPATR